MIHGRPHSTLRGCSFLRNSLSPKDFGWHAMRPATTFCSSLLGSSSLHSSDFRQMFRRWCSTSIFAAAHQWMTNSASWLIYWPRSSKIVAAAVAVAAVRSIVALLLHFACWLESNASIRNLKDAINKKLFDWIWSRCKQVRISETVSFNYYSKTKPRKLIIPDSLEFRGFRNSAGASVANDAIGPTESVTSHSFSVLLLLAPSKPAHPFWINCQRFSSNPNEKRKWREIREWFNVWLVLPAKFQCFFAHFFLPNFYHAKNAMIHSLWAKNLSMSSLSVCSSQLYESVVNALSSSSSREWFSAESNELVLSKLELSSGDFDRNDIRSKPQPSNVESMMPSMSILGVCCWWLWTVDDDDCDPLALLLCWLLRFGGNGGGLLSLLVEMDRINIKQTMRT